jgi:hypothetical protein
MNAEGGAIRVSLQPITPSAMVGKREPTRQGMQHATRARGSWSRIRKLVRMGRIFSDILNHGRCFAPPLTSIMLAFRGLL